MGRSFKPWQSLRLQRGGGGRGKRRGYGRNISVGHGQGWSPHRLSHSTNTLFLMTDFKNSAYQVDPQKQSCWTWLRCILTLKITTFSFSLLFLKPLISKSNAKHPETLRRAEASAKVFKNYPDASLPASPLPVPIPCMSRHGDLPPPPCGRARDARDK